MPPRVTYWTGVWNPEREALSKEVAALRSGIRPRPPVVSFSPGQRTVLQAAGGVIQLSSRRWVLLRILAALLERRGDVSHVFGSINDWHLLRAVGRRPVLFTAALPGRGPSVTLWSRVSVFVAETSALARDLIDAGAPTIPG